MIRIAEYWQIVVFPLILLIVSVFVIKDWREWKRYYPTLLFIFVVDLITSVLTYNYRLWNFHKALFLPNHTLNDLWIVFTQFPLIFFMYLSRYPYKSSWMKQVVYIAIWVVSMSLVEAIYVILKFTTYHNGWNFWWSVLFWIATFPILSLHQTKPLFAWLLYFIISLFVITYFHIPINRLD